MTRKSSDALPGDAEDRDPVLVEVGQRLIDARLDYGRRLKPIRAVSQAEIGRLIGVTGVTVGAWEAGKNDAGTPMLYRLADLYGVRRAWLLAGDGDMRLPRAGNTHGAQLVPTDMLTAIDSGDDLRKALGEPPAKGKKPGRAG
jgi:transcriptional regulator with XRE-family HTH domain